MTDAVVVGAGPNGLVAANLLADAGWSVVVLEEQQEPGGAVKTAELTPGVQHDVFSAFYPLTARSKVFKSLELERYGLRWVSAPIPLAHPRPDGSCPHISHDVEATSRSLDGFASGDGETWLEISRMWHRIGGHLLDSLLSLFPPVVPALKLALRARTPGMTELARLAVTPVRTYSEQRFRSDAPAMLLAGNALHADLGPETPLSALFGWLLMNLAQDVGFPVPEGGAGKITDALVARLDAAGGKIICGQQATKIMIDKGRAVSVRTQGGDEYPFVRAVIADVGAPYLYRDMIGEEHLPIRVMRAIDRFRYDSATVKVDWALDSPIPWGSEIARKAGTIHVSDDLAHLSDQAAAISKNLIPERPYLVVGQMDVADPSRLASGKHTAWAYTHIPQEVRGDEKGEITGRWDWNESEHFADRMESEIERLAPGFKDCISARHIITPPHFEEMNANLVGGALNGGTAQLHQQLILRPIPGMARPETPIPNVYLGSASAHPGGGVHGACGANAAKAALGAEDRSKRVLAVGAGAVLAGALTKRVLRKVLRAD